MSDADATALNLTVNGEATVVPAPLTIDGLLAHLGVDTRHVAVERNRELVKKDLFESTVVVDGDRFEIVTLVGGG